MVPDHGPVDPEGKHGVADKQLEELESAIHPREHRVFFGALDTAKLGFLERRLVKAVKAPEGDFRDWDQIRAFADRIADALTQGRAPTG